MLILPIRALLFKNKSAPLKSKIRVLCQVSPIRPKLRWYGISSPWRGVELNRLRGDVTTHRKNRVERVKSFYNIGNARYCRNARRHCDLLHFRGYRNAQRNHAKVWQSTAYRKPRIAPNRLIDRAVERICNSFITGRSPRIFMQHHQAMLCLKMKILGMTQCVYEGIYAKHKSPH